MKRIIALVTLFIVSAVPLFAARRVVPVAGHAPGANNTFWTTDLQLSNSSDSTRIFRLTFHPSGRDSVTRDITLGGHESRLLEDVVEPRSFGAPDDTKWIGELEIESPDDFAATARTFTREDKGDGTFGSVSESVDPSNFANHGTVTGIVVDDRFRSNLALTNAGDDPVRVHVELHRRDGSLASSDDVTIAGHQTVQQPVRRADDSRLSMHWSSDDRAYVSASIVDNKSGDPSESRSVATASRSAFFPLVGKTPGANGTFWTTSVSITNTEDRAGDATIEYRGNDGRRESRTMHLEPRGTFHSDDVFEMMNVASGSGLLSVDSSVDMTSAARVFNTREDGGTYGSTMQPQDRGSRSSLVRIKGVRRSDDFRLNVAIADDNGVDATGTIRLFDDRHQQVESEPFHVRAGSAQQFAIAQTRIPVSAGEIEVETEHGVEVIVIASNIDNRSGDTVVSETEHKNENENEHQQELEIRMSAKTAAVGAPIAFTAVTPSGTTNIQWDFGDGKSASGASVSHAYASAGEFNVTLIVTLAGGAQLRKTDDVKIGAESEPPSSGPGAGTSSIDFTWSPGSVRAGQTVTFTATITGTPAAGSTIKWRMPDKSRPTGSSASFTFATAGTYSVEVELEQPGKATVQSQHSVTVR